MDGTPAAAQVALGVRARKDDGPTELFRDPASDHGEMFGRIATRCRAGSGMDHHEAIRP